MKTFGIVLFFISLSTFMLSNIYVTYEVGQLRKDVEAMKEFDEQSLEMHQWGLYADQTLSRLIGVTD